MKTEIILCPTVRVALYAWHRLTDTYPDMFVNICRNPMSLTSITGTKYIFCPENETYKLKGLRCDFISIDEFDIHENEEGIND